MKRNPICLKCFNEPQRLQNLVDDVFENAVNGDF